MVTPTRKHKYEEVDVSEMAVCNSTMVHGAFIGEVSPVKHSQTKTDVRFFWGEAFRREENGADGVIRAQAKGHSRESMGEWWSGGGDKLFCAGE